MTKGKVLIKKTSLKHCNDAKAFIEYSNDMQDVYENIEKYNIDKKPKILIAFDNIIDGMINDKILNPVVIELFTSGRKSNISIVFITQSYFKENMSDYTLPTFAL